MRIKTFSLAAARHKNVRHSDGYVEYLEHQKYIHVQAIQHDWDFPSEKETTGSTALVSKLTFISPHYTMFAEHTLRFSWDFTL